MKLGNESVNSLAARSSSSNTELMQKEADKFEMYVNVIEKYAFFVFLVLFVIFNVIYWTWLFESSGFYKWPEVNPDFNAEEDSDTHAYSQDNANDQGR